MLPAATDSCILCRRYCTPTTQHSEAQHGRPQHRAGQQADHVNKGLISSFKAQHLPAPPTCTSTNMSVHADEVHTAGAAAVLRTAPAQSCMSTAACVAVSCAQYLHLRPDVATPLPLSPPGPSSGWHWQACLCSRQPLQRPGLYRLRCLCWCCLCCVLSCWVCSQEVPPARHQAWTGRLLPLLPQPAPCAPAAETVKKNPLHPIRGSSRRCHTCIAASDEPLGNGANTYRPIGLCLSWLQMESTTKIGIERCYCFEHTWRTSISLSPHGCQLGSST